ncbi:ATP-dependent Zn protease [Phormidium yuhuli AB48]|uniref:ATP-dependent Zn protease n=1 Tax=Phormidium yuhuli AB48 TaxID=2940671 RepID=A0ABY5ARN2_9CYAN|nr:ATP-dependent Zn protease [Phormidium yuhuli]USR91561.1 ATP-dependent Zn protease [Phormidium yuhuli AB48]
MSQFTLNVLAIGIFSLTMFSLLGPMLNLSPLYPAATVFVLLGLATVDQLGFQGQGGQVFLDWLGANTGDRRQRVIRHEAGHFLVAYLLDVPIANYSLSAWEALKQGQSGRGGVQFDDGQLLSELSQGQLSAQQLNRYAMVWMAGIAAEELDEDSARGGIDDRQQLRLVLRQLRPVVRDSEARERWAILQARTLIDRHRDAYEALVEAMSQRLSVQECCDRIQEHLTPAVS